MSTQESERRRPNPFYLAFDLLRAKLLAADQALGVSEAVFEHATESPQEWLERIPEGEMPGMVADICDSSSGCVKYRPSLSWPDRGIDYLLRAVRDFRTQSYLWTIARSFEHFREFVETVEAELADSDGVCTGEGSEPSKDTGPNEDRRFDLALRRVRDAAPALVACEMTNARKIQLQQWIRGAAAIRHAVAHNEGILRKEVYEKYRDSGLEEHFPGELEEDAGYVLKPTPKTAARAVRTFREYGVAIYKSVSEAHGFPATLAGPDGEITTWRR